VKRILLTGMSGTGKSSLIAELAALGYRALDVDDAGWTERAPDGGWIWQEDVVERFLKEDEDDEAVLFLSGCAESQVRFYPLFDHIVLLSAPPDVILQRLRLRKNNPYGKAARERAEVLEYVRTVEPLLRKAADHEVDAAAPLAQVLASVLRLVDEPDPRPTCSTT
jgi:shikimate kinase